ncbi:MAG: LPS assembly protein LptD [Alphaproteobacteria bacterium]|nr:LPS assembly protein LptD [Alphaproteobacteria bacterium]
MTVIVALLKPVMDFGTAAIVVLLKSITDSVTLTVTVIVVLLKSTMDFMTAAVSRFKPVKVAVTAAVSRFKPVKVAVTAAIARFKPVKVAVSFTVTIAVVLLMSPTVAGAQEEKNPPLLLEAGEILYSGDGRSVRASGGAAVSWQGRSLRAEEIHYNLESGILTTSAGATFTSEEGDQYFAHELVLQDDFARGTASLILGFLSDESQVFAETMEFDENANGNSIIRMFSASYSACRCQMEENDASAGAVSVAVSADGSSPPHGLEGEDELSWQVNADSVVWDTESRTVRYRNARIKLFGRTILYTPYISLPDPGVERRSGFLTPRFAASSYLGQFTQLRYYFAVAPDTNLQLEPFLSSQRGPGLGMVLEQVYENGDLSLEGQLTQSIPGDARGEESIRRQRGYIFADYSTDITRHWRAGLLADIASDKSYLSEYRIDPQRAQQSQRVWLEGFSDTHYLRAQGIRYQSLRQNETPESEELRQPSVLPLLDWHWRGAPWRGYYPEVVLGLRALRRPRLGNSQRVTLRPSVSRNHINALGQVVSGNLALQSSFYAFTARSARALQTAPDPTAASGSNDRRTKGNFYPLGSIGWRWPLVLGAPEDRRRHLLEPRVQLAGVLGSPNLTGIPNEESQSLELDRARLFLLNRYPGLDQTEEGVRLDYGTSLRSSFGAGRDIEFFLGQSRRLDDKNVRAPEYSGFQDSRTDWVAEVHGRRYDTFSVSSAFRLAHSDYKVTSHDTEFRVGRVDGVHMVAGYFYGLEHPPPENILKREELEARVGTPLPSRGWRSEFFFVRDLERVQTRRVGLDFLYEDPCLEFVVSLFQDYIGEAGSVDPESGIFIGFNLRTLSAVRVR